MKKFQIGDMVITYGPFLTDPEQKKFDLPIIGKISHMSPSGQILHLDKISNRVFHINTVFLYEDKPETQNFEEWEE